MNAHQAAQLMSRRKRERTQIEFPYTGLGQAVEMTRILHERGGGNAEREQLAAWMDVSANGGTFRSRVSASVMFGFMSAARGGDLAITDLGRRAVGGDDGRGATVDAFLNVPLFGVMFEKFKGYALPPATAIERQMLEVGVPQKQKERARQTFIKSAQAAGYIDASSGRLAKPYIEPARNSPPPTGQVILIPMTVDPAAEGAAAGTAVTISLCRGF